MSTWQQRNPLVQCRLDYCLISSFLSTYVTDDRIRSSIKTDHSLISLQIQGNLFEKRGPGFWKLNSTLLKDAEYVRKVKDLIHICTEKYKDVENKGLVWDTIKCEIRGMTIKFSKLKARLQRSREQNLQKELENLNKNKQLNETEQTRLREIEKE